MIRFARALVAIVALLQAPHALAGWFGVWSYEDCVKTYVVPAQVSNAVGIATRACKGLYEQKHTGASKTRDDCILEHILDAKTVGAAAALARTCNDATPICKPNEAERSDACEVKCQEGQVYLGGSDEPICFSPADSKPE
jgi:hypothetical protein